PEGSHIIANTPTRFMKTSDGGYLLPVHFFNRGNNGVFKLDVNGILEFVREYPITEHTMFTNYLLEIDGYYYISGHHSRTDFQTDVMVQKISLDGEEIWLKHYGTSQYGEFSAG